MGFVLGVYFIFLGLSISIAIQELKLLFECALLSSDSAKCQVMKGTVVGIRESYASTGTLYLVVIRGSDGKEYVTNTAHRFPEANARDKVTFRKFVDPSVKLLSVNGVKSKNFIGFFDFIAFYYIIISSVIVFIWLKVFLRINRR